MLRRSEAITQINSLSSNRIPFFFFTDFEGSTSYITELEKLDRNRIRFDFSNRNTPHAKSDFHLSKKPISYKSFIGAFDQVVKEIRLGNSFLTNLTFKTPIELSIGLKEIYQQSQAPYKLWYEDEFVVFSPESFVQISEVGEISSFPMKGTIDASIPNAVEVILQDEKEIAEHITIVDLIRNDLSQVACKVQVPKFRFVQKIKSRDKELIQVSSEVRGQLPDNWHTNLGSTLFKLLPAGSISGAPKPKTVEIIKSVEDYCRGFYTGIMGLFDGRTLDTAVMIRFIEKEGNQLFFKSGAGITSFSDPKKEYQEIIDKIYVPIH